MRVQQTIGAGNGVSIDEMREWLARPRVNRGNPRSVAIKDGPALFMQRGDEVAAICTSTVSVNVKDRHGAALFRWTVDVEIDTERGRVRRGRQTFEPIKDGPADLTATLIRRDARLGDAWVEAVELATTGENHPMFARVASTTVDAPRSVDYAAERTALADWWNGCVDRGERPTTEQVRQWLSTHRREPVTAGVARQVKHQARRRGLIPPSDNGTRPTT